MLYYENLDEIIFTKEQLISCDELVILSGYVGPNPIHKLNELGVKSTVIYGMYGSDGIRKSLHEALIKEHQDSSKVEILYSTIPVHSKCYVWKKCGEVQCALIGSANFSNNGLKTPFREMLADASVDSFYPLNKYLELVLEKSIVCEEASFTENPVIDTRELESTGINDEVCTIPLYIMESGRKIVPEKSGLNWCFADSHGAAYDAYLKISTKAVKQYPKLFPQKRKLPTQLDIPRSNHRNNDNVEILWDDGMTMMGLLEGSQQVAGLQGTYPKNFSSSPAKSVLGKYIRQRLGITEYRKVTYEDLIAYGRDTIDVSLQGEGIYYFDFSVSR